jgi:cephalosporin-C deacetylase
VKHLRTFQPRSLSTVAAVLLLAAATHAFAAAPLTLTPYHAGGIYKLGETVGWKVTPNVGAAAEYQYTVKKNNMEVIKTGALHPADAGASIEVSLNEPAMLYVEVTAGGQSIKDAKGNPLAVGAAVAPEQLQPSQPPPADFDAFWASKVKLLEAVPANPVLTPGDAEGAGGADIEYDTIKMDHLDGGHVYGQLAKPHREGKFPGLVIFQYASPPYPLQKQWVTDRAKQGWLALNIEPHDVLPTQPKAYYDALPKELKNYQSIGQEDRDKNYFLKMYLADYRAVEYLASRPDWDRKTLVVTGMSMGGQQSFAVAGLNPTVTHLIVNVPAGCDLDGALHGRATGYPFWPSNNAKIMATAPYFDAVNFASHIHATCMVAMGFVDTTAPPVGIWTAFDQIQGPKEAVPMVDSPHNHLATGQQQQPWVDRSEAWLAALVKGEPAPVRALSDAAAGGAAADHRAVLPMERMDHNSQLAHTQMLAKAKSGHIDVYFEGDSITRRWGASDEQYKTFLANWKQNFFGWNAADFGWGGDTVQNILWRLNHGELDDVHPKVIVLLAGTNNVGNRIPAGHEDAKVAEVTSGIQEILAVFHQKAPEATVLLTAITPRNDNPAVMPIINRINENLSHLADGHPVRYLNINDKLADADGKLFEGMTNPDQLHLTVKAYQIWADALKPQLTELLGPPSAVDLAPAPTGDPSSMPPPSHALDTASTGTNIHQ